MINAFLLFFVIHTTQVGVGIQGFQRIIYEDAKHDAWISVLLIGILTHIVAFVMIKTLDMYDSDDLYGIHQDIFGEWIGKFLTIIYIIYCSSAFFFVIRNYIEVVQTWVFPELDTWFISATLLLIVIYTFTGGFRVIVGISFFSFILGIWLILFLLYPLQQSEFVNLLPILENKFSGILKGAYSMTFTIIGFEVLYAVYPFVKEKDKVQKYVHLGLLMTTFLYLIVMLVTLTYFSGEQLAKTIWATLSLFSVVTLPFIERFEYLAVCFWMIIILPNLCLYLWAAYRGTIRIVKVKPTKFVWIFSSLIFIVTLMIETRSEINTANDYFSKIAFYIVFAYPFILYLMAYGKRKLSKSKERT
jgi:spore germination protein (amino acid permease)